MSKLDHIQNYKSLGKKLVPAVLMLLDKKDNKPTRVRTKILKDKKKVRISVLSGDQIDA